VALVVGEVHGGHAALAELALDAVAALQRLFRREIVAVGSGSTTRMTETGVSVGTPQYMSPEQATGDQHVGPAADIHALGCVLYEMLAGEPLFRGSTPQAILGKIVLGKPTPLRTDRLLRERRDPQARRGRRSSDPYRDGPARARRGELG
jgi:serine/threonine protein kinase